MEEQKEARSVEQLAGLRLLSSGGLEHLCTQEQRHMTKSLKDRRLRCTKNTAATIIFNII